MMNEEFAEVEETKMSIRRKALLSDSSPGLTMTGDG